MREGEESEMLSTNIHKKAIPQDLFSICCSLSDTTNETIHFIDREK
jgi:hypothetical protein